MSEDLFISAREASKALARKDAGFRSEVLLRLADTLEAGAGTILAANGEDLAACDPSNPKYDRLRLDGKRIADIAAALRSVAGLPEPQGRTLSETVRPNGLKIRRVACPFGVVGIIYESRPNVTFDVFALCFKTGNACVLKGGHEADKTNRAAVAMIKDVLAGCGADPCLVSLLPATREAASLLLGAEGLVDVIIPRGSAGLIRFARENSRVPVIETGAGVCHTYFDASGDLVKGRAIITNAKTRRVSVCNAMDTLLIHESRLADLPALCEWLATRGVEIFADGPSLSALDGRYPMLVPARNEDFGTEFLDYKMAVRTVASLDRALSHIAAYGSGHSECIVTEDAAAAGRFCDEVDTACVYVNAPTSFSDGGEFGLGAEIGISTQKLHARGPMGLEALTTYKWIIEGNGQTRP